jgi:TolB-like protein
MNNVCFIFLFLFSLVFPGFALSALPSIAVVDFDSGSFCTVQEAAVMTDAFRNEMVRSGKADIIDRAHTETLKAEMQFQMSDWVSPAKIKTAGHFLGVDYFMFGNFGIMGRTGYLQVQMTEVETGRIIHSARISLHAWQEFDQKINAFTKEFTNKIPMPDMLVGSWTMPLERDGNFDIYTITFLTKTTCIVKISSMAGVVEVSQEAGGTYSFDGSIFKLFVNFRNPVIPGVHAIQWTSVLSFNDTHTAFNILAHTAANPQTRVTFTKE